MAITKYNSEAITSGAGLEVQTPLVTTDGNQVRTLTGIQCSDHTPGNKVSIIYNSKRIVEIDNSVFATLNEFADLNIDVPVNLDCEFAFLNATGGGLTAQITYRYTTQNI